VSDMTKADARPLTNTRIFGSDLVAWALREQRFPYICLNPGASFRGLHDSLVNFLDNETPRIIVCLHEEHAVGIAQGWAKVTDTPLAVAVHSNVGLMHASMGIFNAWCDRAPMVVIGATGPVDAARRRPWIEWIHTTIDQGGLVRGYTKWDDQPGSAVAAVEAIRRGTALAKARPSGPVYVNLDVGLQEGELEDWPKLHDPSRFAAPADPEPPRAELERAIAVLSKAERPFIFAGRATRSEEGWRNRVRLAELIDARVATHMKMAAGFPTSHPAFFGETGARLKPAIVERMRSADAILLLDWLDPGGTLNQAFAPGAAMPPIVNVTNDFHVHTGWNMDYGSLPAVDVHIPTPPEPAVLRLVEALGAVRGNVPAQAPRRVRIDAPQSSGPIGLMDLARTFYRVIESEPICITGRPLGWPSNANLIDHPLGFLGHSGGGGLGAGPSIAVGAALALREMGSERIAVAILGDGDFTMGATALWNAASLKLPVLYLIANNSSYYNDEHHQKQIAGRRDRPEDKAWVGQRMQDPEIDLVGLARAQGVDGEGPVRDLADLPQALERALDHVRGGRAFVLDVRVPQEYVGKDMVTLT
jgi:thiamine pyrophosphate-dependent acetolactate synthase large subunit-like protein